MMDFVLQYGLFAAKTLTVVVAAWAVIALVASLSRRARQPEQLEVTRLNDRYTGLRRTLEAGILPHRDFKAREKARRRERKALSKRSAEQASTAKRLFVLNFRGDIRASAVIALREEITALLTMARPEDEVVLRLENAGGLVHDHGLAASQLARIRSRGIPLTVAVDKIAASGGYMMACVGTRIIAAPFAVLGSIGVLIELPNFHRLLDTHGIDFELLKGGEYKRKLTLFGENTAEDRVRMQQEVDETHALFKDFVREHRPQLDMSAVATGEHWYGRRALNLALCDELRTSDDYLLAASREAELYELVYVAKKPVIRKLADIMGDLADTALRRRLTMAV
ncbi:MAG: protease SohB [Gammaproteobacteria bacterium]|nr:protease SohB [Gammaproteobacteria bacterium]NIM74029.1 protease SohB [Gammaproteobacteria bacterium]NIN38911.1 protease SohB [Gammaproteobacteria bacterium]NIO25804.1 protease SohB [Gammaproteobacteria bacterium]NIO66435.1 protease SohB [Gammaproteobacteria bacterium]